MLRVTVCGIGMHSGARGRALEPCSLLVEDAVSELKRKEREQGMAAYKISRFSNVTMCARSISGPRSAVTQKQPSLMNAKQRGPRSDAPRPLRLANLHMPKCAGRVVRYGFRDPTLVSMLVSGRLYRNVPTAWLGHLALEMCASTMDSTSARAWHTRCFLLHQGSDTISPVLRVVPVTRRRRARRCGRRSRSH